ncbi:MAG TPA: sigma-70 family RNA polymerase sigma factor [Actinomycetota bacterium]
MIGETFEEVLQAARTGLDWAFESLYRDLSPSVIGYLRAQGASDPEELTSDVFVEMIRSLPKFDGDEETLRTWVFWIAHRRLLEELEWRPWRKDELADPQHLADALAARDREAAEVHAFKRVGTRWAAEALVELPPEERTVFLLRVIGGLDVSQVAQVLDKPVSGVRALQSRAVGRLGRKVEEDAVA